MRFDTIVVPRGAEVRAVKRGWQPPPPSLCAVPAGAPAGDAIGSITLFGTALVLGVCGALDPSLCVGDVAVYSAIREGASTIELDPLLAHRCSQALTTTPVLAAHVSRVIGRATAKAELRAASGAAVIDMEAAALARALHKQGVRVAMVRIVSDAAAGELPDLDAVYRENGSLRPLTLTATLMRTPLRSVRFILSIVSALGALRTVARELASAPD